MKTNPNDFITQNQNSEGVWIDSGLTKREYFAAMAMQAICGNDATDNDIKITAELSVKIADALIKELNKESEK